AITLSCLALLPDTTLFRSLCDSGNEFIYALDIGGGNVNTKTGDFVFHIQVAMVIKNGKPTAIIPPFLYRGNAINVLDNIGWVSKDRESTRLNSSHEKISYT